METEDEEPAKDFRMQKSEDAKADSADSDGYFVYGSQKLKKRQLTGNPLIPSDIYHVLEGGEPEMVMHALAEGESLMLIGDSGVGKSKLIQFLAQETNTPLVAPCGHAEVTAESLLGGVHDRGEWFHCVAGWSVARGYEARALAHDRGD